MKKTITVLGLSLIILAIPSFVLAQGNQQGQGGQQGQGAGAGQRGIDTAKQNLNRVVTRNNNPEVGEQLRTMVQKQEKVQDRTNTALHQMSQRGQFLKFLIGPDYKNAGQVRSDVVGLRNDIRELERVKADLPDADVGDVQGAMDDLQAEADNLETQLEEQFEGFSLFGWLAKMLAQ